jgi:hypothetical protein
MTTQAETNRRNREFWGQKSELPVPMVYEQRFVAYIDILGWKDACRDPRRHAEVSAVAKTLNELPTNFSHDLKERLNHTKGVVPDPSHQKTEVVAFSDSLAISTPADLGHTLFFKFLTIVCRGLLTDGFLTRGGVTVGDLYHKENMIFGPALIDAVELEQKEAIYPRLLCSRELVSEIDCCPSREPSDQQVIINDHLGRSVVNLLAFTQQNNPASWHDIEKKITGIIEAGELQDSQLEKWRYMLDVLQKMIQGAGKS